LRVAADFGRGSRALMLEGEAYFQVTSGSAPFLVRTGTVTTRVLGTTFDVRRYPHDRATHVAVITGKVSVGSAPRVATVVTARQVVLVTDSSVTTASTDATSAARWVDGRLVFNDAPASDVLAALTRWYGYHFTLTDSTLAQKNLTVWLSTESSQAALATLKLALSIDLEFHGKEIVISPRRQFNDRSAKIRRPVDNSPSQIREVGL
jgi:ferric-dicitrate binding protein FerR (iron transport regulator)